MRASCFLALMLVPFQIAGSRTVAAQEVLDGKLTYRFEGQNCSYVQRYTVERRDKDSDEYLVTHSLRELFDKNGEPVHSSLSTYGLHERRPLSEVQNDQGKTGKKLDML